MKKTFVVLMMIVAMAFGLIGCHDDNQPKELESVDGSSFLIVEYGVNYDIVYHKETKVMYIVSDGEYNRGNFTVMVNADGAKSSPFLWADTEVWRKLQHIQKEKFKGRSQKIL